MVYREALLKAVRARDADGVLTAMAPDVRRRFEHWLRLPQKVFGGGEQEDWNHMEWLLALGGSFTTTRGAGRRHPHAVVPHLQVAPLKPVSSGTPRSGPCWAPRDASHVCASRAD